MLNLVRGLIPSESSQIVQRVQGQNPVAGRAAHLHFEIDGKTCITFDNGDSHKFQRVRLSFHNKSLQSLTKQNIEYLM